MILFYYTLTSMCFNDGGQTFEALRRCRPRADAGRDAARREPARPRAPSAPSRRLLRLHDSVSHWKSKLGAHAKEHATRHRALRAHLLLQRLLRSHRAAPLRPAFVTSFKISSLAPLMRAGGDAGSVATPADRLIASQRERHAAPAPRMRHVSAAAHVCAPAVPHRQATAGPQRPGLATATRPTAPRRTAQILPGEMGYGDIAQRVIRRLLLQRN